MDRLPELLEAVRPRRSASWRWPRPAPGGGRTSTSRPTAGWKRWTAPARPAGRQAYVRVQRGCDKFCAYCVVPYVRGSEQSRRPSAIVQEVRRLAEAGCTEVTLLGQTVNSYRYDEGGRVVGLADLLEMLDAVAGLQRIRFVTSYPADFDRRHPPGDARPAQGVRVSARARRSPAATASWRP